LELLCSH